MSPPPTHFTLNNGMKMPSVGLGTWSKSSTNEEVAQAVEEAIKLGYRHIDAARFYPTEPAVGAGIKAAGIPRSELFITSKIWPTHHTQSDAARSLRESLAALQTDYIELLLVHWPLGFASRGASTDPPQWCPTTADGTLDVDRSYSLSAFWKVMESFVEAGLVKAIGVSNFQVAHLEEVLKEAKIKPVCNQVECHVWEQQKKLKKYCDEKGILVVAFTPLGRIPEGDAPATKEELETVEKVAEKYGVGVAPVLVSFLVKMGICAVPKSFNGERLKKNLELIDLSEEDMKTLEGLDKAEKGRMHGSIDFTKNGAKTVPEWVDAWLAGEL